MQKSSLEQSLELYVTEYVLSCNALNKKMRGEREKEREREREREKHRDRERKSERQREGRKGTGR